MSPRRPCRVSFCSLLAHAAAGVFALLFPGGRFVFCSVSYTLAALCCLLDIQPRVSDDTMTCTAIPSRDRAVLVALRCGLPPHAEHLDCEDLRGPRALFGESANRPRPVGDWTEGCRCADKGRGAAYANSAVLWQDTGGRSPLELAEEIAGEEARLSPLAVPVPTYVAGRCTSTFALAWDLVEDGLLPAWGAVLASCQKEGRGQTRRHWHSPRGNMHVTFRLPAEPLLQGDAASLVTGYLLVLAFRALGFPLSLKWPNDLLLEEQGKAGGLLLEERNGTLLAGLGVNLAETPPAAFLREQGATRAALLLPESAIPGSAGAQKLAAEGETIAPFVLWRRLVSESVLAYSRFVAGRPRSGVLKDVEAVMAWKGREVAIRDGTDPPLSGRLLGLGPGGGLHLLRSWGETQEIFSGSLRCRECD